MNAAETNPLPRLDDLDGIYMENAQYQYPVYDIDSFISHYTINPCVWIWESTTTTQSRDCNVIYNVRADETHCLRDLCDPVRLGAIYIICRPTILRAEHRAARIWKKSRKFSRART